MRSDRWTRALGTAPEGAPCDTSMEEAMRMPPNVGNGLARWKGDAANDCRGPFAARARSAPPVVGTRRHTRALTCRCDAESDAVERAPFSRCASGVSAPPTLVRALFGHNRSSAYAPSVRRRLAAGRMRSKAVRHAATAAVPNGAARNAFGEQAPRRRKG